MPSEKGSSEIWSDAFAPTGPSHRCNAIATAFKQHLNSVATRRAKNSSHIARCSQTTGRRMPPVRDQGQPRRGTGSVGLTLEGLEVGPLRPRLSPSTEGFGEASPAWQAGYWGGRKNKIHVTFVVATPLQHHCNAIATAFKQRCNVPSEEPVSRRHGGSGLWR